MAFTQTVVKKTVMGDMRVNIISCTAGAVTEANIETGLNQVLGYVISSASMTTSTYVAIRNTGSTATSLAGVLGVSGLTAGDAFQVICFGT